MWPDFRVRQRDYLLEIARALTSQLDLAEVLRLILEAAVELLGGQAGLIALLDSDDSFAVHASYGSAKAVVGTAGEELPVQTGTPDSAELTTNSLLGGALVVDEQPTTVTLELAAYRPIPPY